MSIFKKKKNISKVSNYMQTYEEEKIIKMKKIKTLMQKI